VVDEKEEFMKKWEDEKEELMEKWREHLDVIKENKLLAKAVMLGRVKRVIVYPPDFGDFADYDLNRITGEIM